MVVRDRNEIGLNQKGGCKEFRKEKDVSGKALEYISSDMFLVYHMSALVQ